MHQHRSSQCMHIKVHVSASADSQIKTRSPSTLVVRRKGAVLIRLSPKIQKYSSKAINEHTREREREREEREREQRCMTIFQQRTLGCNKMKGREPIKSFPSRHMTQQQLKYEFVDHIKHDVKNLFSNISKSKTLKTMSNTRHEMIFGLQA